jgi:predicted DNA-binding transcriptional regulator YafY
MSGILDVMSGTSARLLRLLSLLQMPRAWPGDELAGRLGVSRRTIRRDVERLRDLGYPVRTAMGAGGGYRLAAGTAMPPLLLDDEEAVATSPPDTVEWLAARLIRLGCEFEVHSPPELIDHLAELAARVARAIR